MYKRNIMSGIAIQFVKIIFKFVLCVIVARVLGAANYGKAAYLMLIFSLISGYGHFGVLNVLTYFRKNDECPPAIQFSTNICYLFVNAFFFGTILMIPVVKIAILPEYSYFDIILGFIFVISAYFSSAMEMYYASDERVYEANKYIALSMLFASLFLCVLCVFGYISVEMYVVAHIIETLISGIMMYKKYDYVIRPQINLNFFIREMKFGKYMYMAALFSYFNYRIDQFMIKSQLGNADLGIYSVSVYLAELLLLLPSSVVSSLTGKLLNVERKSDEEKTVLCGTIRVLFFLAIIVAIIGICCTPLIHIVYGTEYVEAEKCFQILIVGVVGLAMAKVMSPYYMIIGKPSVNTWATCAIFIVNICLNFVLIPIYKMNGAAMASTISYLLYGVIYYALYLLHLKINPRDLFLIKKTDIESIMKG